MFTLMHLLRFAVCWIFLSLGAFAASSDNYTYGSAAWGEARNNERANAYRNASSPNRSSTVDMSAEKAKLYQYFQSIQNSSSQNYVSEREQRMGAESDRLAALAERNRRAPVREATYEEKLQARLRAGDISAMVEMGDILASKAGTYKDANSWYEKAANAGNLKGMEKVFLMKYWGGTYHGDDVPRAMGWLKTLADSGDFFFEGTLGSALLIGEGVKQDKPLGFSYLVKAAAHGDGRYYFPLGDAYLDGDGVGKNIDKAIESYRAYLQGGSGYFTRQLVEFRLAQALAIRPGSGAESRAEIEKLLRVHQPMYNRMAALYAQLLESGIWGPRDMPKALENYTRAYTDAIEQQRPNAMLNVDQGFRMSAAEIQLVFERAFEIYLHGDGVPRDLAKAREVGLSGVKVCKTFHPLALGFMLVDPKLGPPESAAALVCFNAHLDNTDALRESAILLLPHSVEEALRRFDTLWVKGDGEAAAWPADYYRQNLKWDPSDKRGSREISRLWARRGAEKNRSDCMARLGYWLGEDARLAPKPADEEAMRAEGLVWLRRGAEAQNPAAMEMLGEVLLAGSDAEKNSAEAVAWIRKSVELGSLQGKLFFANLLIEGKHVSEDKATALKLLGEAAPESPAAANTYGVSLWRGDLGRQDVAEGLQWLEASLKAEYWPAGRNLAKIYHLGAGVPKDEARADRYLQNAIFVGQEPAKRLAAEAYDKGEIINADQDKARELYRELEMSNPTQNTTLLAAYYLRHGDLISARRAMELKESAGSAEAMRLKSELEAAERKAAANKLAHGESILAEARPHLPEKLEANLVLLEAAAAKPAGNRPAFFRYFPPGTGNFEKDDDYQAVELLPQSPESEMFLVWRDMEQAVEGSFHAAQVECSGYFHRDPLLGPRYFAAIRKLVFADANGGDTSAMIELVNLLGVPSDERPNFGWPRDHRESFHWCHRALLLGDAGGLDDITRLCSAEKPAENIDKKTLAQWAAAIEKIREIQKNESDPAAVIAAYCKDHLPPE
jgi:TPR repeat protein